jgi:hypothetical protein
MERRYTDAEVAELLSAAAQRQSGGGKEGWTAEQVLAMAGELGIDRELVRTQIAASELDATALASTTEIIPSSALSFGAPRNVTLRRRVRGRVPEYAIEDAAEDARRSLSKVRRLEVRQDELIVEGSYPGVQAVLYIESNPSHSVISLSLDNRRCARWIHVVSQAIVLFFSGMNYIGQVSWAGWFFVLLALFASLAFGIGSLLSFIVARTARMKAEKDFGLISHRVARSAQQSAEEPVGGQPRPTLRERLRPGHEV